MVVEIDGSGGAGSRNQDMNKGSHILPTESPRRKDTSAIEAGDVGQKTTLMNTTRNGASIPTPTPPPVNPIFSSRTQSAMDSAIRAKYSDGSRQTIHVSGSTEKVPKKGEAPQRPTIQQQHRSADSESDRDTVDKPQKSLLHAQNRNNGQVKTLVQAPKPKHQARPAAASTLVNVNPDVSKTISTDGKLPIKVEKAKSGINSVPSTTKHPSAPNILPTKLPASGSKDSALRTNASQTVVPKGAAAMGMMPQANRPAPRPDDSLVAPENSVQKLREPLVNKYGLLVHPSDTSLADARKRLRTALEQTRLLRVAFTDRVYEKYRVVLRPIPTTEAVVRRIEADPIGTNTKLQDDIRRIKDEKEAEKKEAQKLAPAVGAGQESGKPQLPGPSGAIETAEQLAYVGAGLNLVILPEEDVDESEVDIAKYEFRGPINPETGLRVGGISAAAATAAEVLLDRVRRAESMRSERQKRKHSSSTDTPASTATIPMRHPARPLSDATDSVARLPLHGVPPVASRIPKRVGTSRSQLSARGRSRPQPSISGNTLLTLDPAVEDILLEGSRPSAATSALISRGVGYPALTRSSHLRQRHPHPTSIAGRTSIEPGRRHDGNASGSFGSFELPAHKKTNDVTPCRTMVATKAKSDRAVRALQSVISQFEAEKVQRGVSTENAASQGASGQTKGTNAARPGSLSPVGRRKRRATEIGLLHGLQHPVDGKQEGLQAVANSQDSTTEDPIEPMFAFSVLLALGLVRDTPTSGRPNDSVSQRLSRLNPSRTSQEGTKGKGWRGSDSKQLNSLFRSISSQKRSFLEGFGARHQTSNQKKEENKIVSEVPKLNGQDGSTEKDVAEKKRPKDHVDTRPPVAGDEDPVVVMRGGGSGEDMSGKGEAKMESDVKSKSENPKATKTTDSAVSKKEVAGGADNVVTGEKEPSDSKQVKAIPSKSPARAATVSRPSSATSTHTTPHALWGDQQTMSLLNSRLAAGAEGLYTSVMAQTRVGATGPSAAFTPPRNQAPGSRMQPHQAVSAVGHHHTVPHTLDRFHPQAHQMHIPGLQHTASLNRLPVHPQSSAGDLADFFGGGIHHAGQRAAAGYAARPEWAALGASTAAVNLLPSHSSLSAMGLAQHSAMVGLSARDRAAAARALLAEQQQNAAAVAHAAAVHRQASAIRNGAGVAGLSPQQAAVLMGTQAGRGGANMFRPSSAGSAGFPRISATAAILSSPAAALIGQTHRTVGAHMNQHSDSRPGSQHSTSSTKSSKTKRPTSAKARKEEDTGSRAKLDSANDSIKTEESAPKRRRIKEVGQDATNKEPTSRQSSPQKSESRKGDPAKAIGERAQVGKPGGAVTKSNPSIVVAKGVQAPQRQKADVTKGETAPSVAAKSQPPPKAQVHREARERTPSEVAASGTGLTAGMQFFVPPIPSALPREVASAVLAARIHEAVAKVLPDDGREAGKNAQLLSEFVQAVGTSVPIPKALVGNPLKERLNSQAFKNQATSAIPREVGASGVVSDWLNPVLTVLFLQVVVSAIMIWLWMQHKSSFQRAFAKSGRIDVDPECKWLIQAAIEAATRALASEKSLSRSVFPGSGLGRVKNGTGSKPDSDKNSTSSTKLELQVASVVSRALMTEVCIDEEVVSATVFSGRILPRAHVGIG